MPLLTPEYLLDIEGFTRRFFRELCLRLGEQPARLRILRGESPLAVSCPKRTASISTARGGNKPR
ncbi:MAG: hypothetical protein ACREXR_12815, partial [Gammaproteobacteria bacterium]